MPDRDKVIREYENFVNSYISLTTSEDYEFEMHKAVLAVLKEQEPRELTIEEWYEWKANRNRDPICILWEHDTSPMWILDPNDVHEPAFLMGKLKLFTGKPTHKQCKEIKWE